MEGGCGETRPEEVDRRGWERYVVVADSYASVTAVRIAGMRPDPVLGMAIGHAALSHSTEGERAPERAGTWDAMAQLARQGSEAFVRHGIAQMTRGGIDEETAQQMIDRFPDMDLVLAMVEAIGQEPEPTGGELAAVDAPLLLANHEVVSAAPMRDSRTSSPRSRTPRRSSALRCVPRAPPSPKHSASSASESLWSQRRGHRVMGSSAGRAMTFADLETETPCVLAPRGGACRRIRPQLRRG